jgi:hypothetical protein
VIKTKMATFGGTFVSMLPKEQGPPILLILRPFDKLRAGYRQGRGGGLGPKDEGRRIGTIALREMKERMFAREDG